MLGRPVLAAASGLTEVDANSPFSLWFSRAVQVFDARREGASLYLVDRSELPSELVDGTEWVFAHTCFVWLTSPDGRSLGGLWLSRQEGFSEPDLAIAKWIGQQAEFALWAWRRDQIAIQERISALSPKRWRNLSQTKKRIIVAVAIIVFLFPVRLSVLAPAEISPLTPIPVTSPTDGVVRRILVVPNQHVTAGTELAEIDDTSMRNRLLVAQKTLDIAKADQQRAASKGFADDTSRSEILLLEARVRERAAEVSYLSEMLARLKLVSERDGVALFSDAEYWRGKPVQVGERIMTIADPSQVAVTIFVSPDDALALDPGAEVRMFLNISPLTSYSAKVVQASYETGTSPEGHPAYIVKAVFENGEPLPRLGLKGTAKVLAERVPMVYYVMRRPLRSVRQALGL